MKTVIRALGTVGVAGLAIYLLRDRLLPPPVIEPEPSPIRGVPRRPAVTEASTDPGVTAVAGIGAVYAARLGEHGITTLAQLAAADPEQVAAAAGARPEVVAGWIAQATELGAG